MPASDERRLLLRLLRERVSRAEVQGDDKSGHAVESDTPIPPAVPRGNRPP